MSCFTIKGVAVLKLSFCFFHSAVFTSLLWRICLPSSFFVPSKAASPHVTFLGVFHYRSLRPPQQLEFVCWRHFLFFFELLLFLKQRASLGISTQLMAVLTVSILFFSFAECYRGRRGIYYSAYHVVRSYHICGTQIWGGKHVPPPPFGSEPDFPTGFFWWVTV